MKGIRFSYLFFGIVFFGCAIAFFLLGLKPELDARHILKKGTETTAVVMDIGTNSSVDGEPYYFITLSFVKSDEEIVTVVTGSIYPESFLVKRGVAAYNDATHKYHAVQKALRVKYIGDKAALMDYVPESVNWALWIFVLIFGAVGVGMFIAFVLNIKTTKNTNRIEQFGANGTGIYLDNRE
jgi:hypothetical protein